MGQFYQWLLCALCLACRAFAEFSPEIHKTVTDKISDDLIYFDDSSSLLNLNNKQLLTSQDDGINWIKKLDNIESFQIDAIKKSRAFAFTASNIHYISNDYGLSWKQFTIDSAANFNYEISVNAKNPDQILLGFLTCDTANICTQNMFYSTDGLNSNPSILGQNLEYCVFAKSNGVFDEGDDSRVFCLESERDENHRLIGSKIISTTDFFISDPTIVNDNAGILATNFVLEIDVIQTFIVVVVELKEAQAKGSSALLYVSKDGVSFRKAIIEGNVASEGFIFLPSTRNSLFISVWSAGNETSVSSILSSDTEGQNFRNLMDQVESNSLGFLHLEKAEKLEGVWQANIMDGYDELTLFPHIKSKITFDDGRTWRYLKTDDCPGNEDCSLNIFSLEETRGDGQSATGATPGILLAVGDTGKSLGSDIMKMKTFVSRDGGLNWKLALDSPSIFSFGDLGNIIVAAPYTKSEETESFLIDTVYYSLDQGSTWSSFNLDIPIIPYLLTTAVDGTTTKFILTGLFSENNQDSKQVLYTLDFSKAFDRVCDSENDFELWYGRSDEQDTRGKCIYGHKDIYKRRKEDARCYINKAFEDLVFDEVACECTYMDYECNFGFYKNSKGECVADNKIIKKLCSESSDEELKLETRRKIPGNMCQGGQNLESTFETIQCSSFEDKPAQGIEVVKTSFEGGVVYYTFLQRSNTEVNETLIVQTSLKQVFISQNGGKQFSRFDTNEEISEVHTNPYYPDNVYLISTNKNIYISKDRGISFQSVVAPSEINVFGLPSISFSNSSQDAFIYYGDENCEVKFSELCKSTAYITDDSGLNWKKLLDGTKTCDFVGSRYIDYGADKNLVYCQVSNENGYSLIASSDKFETQDLLFSNIVGFASTSHFTVVASIDGDSLQAFVTTTGNDFVTAKFPPDYQVKKQQAYTILGSESGAIFLHVTSNERAGSEFGGILKSDADGISYVLSEKYVNRNSLGYVDFERVEGLEGIALINTVKNYEDAFKGSLKQLVSKITFNDGANWDYIQPPTIDSEGNRYTCIGKPLTECSLHLHGYTERKDFRDTFSSASATGVLLAVGNVGDKLASFRDASTFITKDGGLTWREIKKGVYQWEFGDRGSIIVLVDDQSDTNSVLYSLNEGSTWNEYQFSDDVVRVEDIVTVPSDTSTRFLLVTRSKSGRGDESRTFTIDFNGIFSRQCVLDFTTPNRDDFEYWSPKQPFSSDLCLFGHEVQYLRKLSDRTDCYIGNLNLDDSVKVIRNCECTRRDFECDYGYDKANDGTCKLVGDTKDPQDICRTDENILGYFEPTGYRKIPMSTCEGGQEFDKGTEIPCPGREREFDEKKGKHLRGFGWFLVTFVPISIFLFSVWFVYDRGIRRNGGFQRFGEIRLGEQDDELIENNTTDKVVNSLVRGSITGIAAIIAVFRTIRSTDTSLLKKLRGIFSSNSRYSRRGAGYTTVAESDFRDEEEAAILGEEEDFNVDDDDDFGDDTFTGGENNDRLHENDISEFQGYEDDRNLE
ncbi:hypothetical protein WICMUC_005752 [Wickerhamomyces mucosus]|uniref:VPS10 domain-containing protein n=1 Tax=Wickerhamomyces mucosus TaxID=1378264 RepID=A0A9P8P385_9ASCO|nr:hypothetical protein WICMUC_005752 [Wickerhamomyces mucosus]